MNCNFAFWYFTTNKDTHYIKISYINSYNFLIKASLFLIIQVLALHSGAQIIQRIPSADSLKLPSRDSLALPADSLVLRNGSLILVSPDSIDVPVDYS